LDGNTLSWTTNEKAKAFLIERNGEFVAIVDGTQNSTTVSDASTSGYTVRAANMNGGFGTPAPVGTVDGITAPVVSGSPVFSGFAADTPRKYLHNGRLVIIKEGCHYNAIGQQVIKQ
jgi:hypothetical protein